MQQVVVKRKVEPLISDNDNTEFIEHVLNRTIKMMSILNALMFRVTKEFHPV